MIRTERLQRSDDPLPRRRRRAGRGPRCARRSPTTCGTRWCSTAQRMDPPPGREALVGYLADFWKTQTDQRRHVLSNAIVESDSPREPVMSFYLTLYATQDRKLRAVATGPRTVVRYRRRRRRRADPAASSSRSTDPSIEPRDRHAARLSRPRPHRRPRAAVRADPRRPRRRRDPGRAARRLARRGGAARSRATRRTRSARSTGGRTRATSAASRSISRTAPTARRSRACSRDADFLIESEPPGVMDARGLGCATLRRDHPRLIYVSITPFGQDGPKARCRRPTSRSSPRAASSS